MHHPSSMSTGPISRFEFLASLFRPIVSLAQKVFTPRVNQALIALTALAMCVGLAILCWQVRDFLAGLAGMALVYFGILLAWELLPFSEQTRARWAQEQQWADRYMSYRWRNALWCGLSMAALRLWRAHADHKLDPDAFLLPAFIVAIGAVAHGVWRLRKRTLQ